MCGMSTHPLSIAVSFVGLWVRFKNKVPTPGDSTPTKPTASMYLLTYLLVSSHQHRSACVLTYLVPHFFLIHTARGTYLLTQFLVSSHRRCSAYLFIYLFASLHIPTAGFNKKAGTYFSGDGSVWLAIWVCTPVHATDANPCQSTTILQLNADAHQCTINIQSRVLMCIGVH